MTEAQIKFAAGLAIGALLAGTAVFLLASREAGDDEDRPPIIVRGGSLLFESDENAIGKPWHVKDKGQNTEQWQPNHAAGKVASWFVIEIEVGQGTGSCPALSMTQGEVTFTRRGQQIKMSMAAGHAGPLGHRRRTATVKGPGLDYDPNNNKRIVHAGSPDAVENVAFTDKNNNQISCNNPTRVSIYQF